MIIHDGWRDLVLVTIESAARTYYACRLDFQMEPHCAILINDGDMYGAFNGIPMYFYVRVLFDQ